MYTCICQRGENRASVCTFLQTGTCAALCYTLRHVMGLGMLTFMLYNLQHTRTLRAKFGWRHEDCNHSKGIFCIKKIIKQKMVLNHTGGVDAMWRLSMAAIACSLVTRVNGHVHPKLMGSIRIWQWRWLNAKENLLEKTGRMLDKRMAS